MSNKKFSPKNLQKMQNEIDQLKSKIVQQEQEIEKSSTALKIKIKNQTQTLETTQVELKKMEEEFSDQRNKVLLNILTPEVINALTPFHSKISCSDQNKNIEDFECPRCAFLDAAHMGYIGFKWFIKIEHLEYEY